MSGTGYVPLPAPVTADPGFWKQGVENLNALRDQQAKQASADAYRQSLNPDGTVNTPKYNALIASGPGAWNAGELMRQQGAAGIAQTGAAQGQFNLASAQNSAVNNAASAALGVPDDQLHASVAQQLQKLVDANMVPRDKAMAWLANLSNDPAQMRQQLKTIWAQTAPPEIGQALRFGQPFRQTGPGGSTIGGTQDITSGAVSSPQGQAGAPQGPSPEAGLEQVDVTITGADGKQYPAKVFKKDIPGYGGSAAGGGSPPQGGAANPPGVPAPGSSGIGSGRINPVPDNPALRKPGAPQPQGGGGAVGGAQPFVTGPAVGEKPAIEETAKSGAAMGNALTARADQVPTNKANYANMLTDLSKLDTMGPGTDKEVAINSALQKLTGYGFSMNREQVAAGNSFAKLANIAVGQQLQSIGGTDARQALFMGSNPNLDLSKLGNQQIIHTLQGNEDAIQAKSRAWQDWQKRGNGPDTYAGFQDDFNHHFDPRVFQQQYMGQSEIASLKKSLTGPGETQKFLDDVKYARQHGWIQ